MTASVVQKETAKIYQFPLRGRFAPAEARMDSLPRIVSPQTAVLGEAWYHDEAIAEAERTRKN